MDSHIDSTIGSLLILDDLVGKYMKLLRTRNPIIILLFGVAGVFEDDGEAMRWLRDLYTKGSHHKSITVLTTIQIAFPKNFRAISLNSNMLCFFPNR